VVSWLKRALKRERRDPLAQQAVEVILMRQLASSLAVPILVVDNKLNLVFFNEPAEKIVGRRFEETGMIRRGEWTNMFRPTYEDGSPVKREEMPLTIAIDQGRPAHNRSCIQGLDGAVRTIEGIAFPLEGQSGRKLGAVGIFWEVEE
jgi:PAS domain-containing protein